MGTREKVRSGKLTAEAAIEMFKKNKETKSKTYIWLLRRVGLKKVAPKEKTAPKEVKFVPDKKVAKSQATKRERMSK